MIPTRLMPFAATENSAAGSGRIVRFMTVSLARELGILLCLSVMVPFMIHLVPVPENARLGPRLLPMFYTPLLAALWGRTWTALAVALAAPWLNWALTSHPSPPGVIVMSVQLLVFVFVLRVLLHRMGSLWFLAAPAYFCAMAASIAVIAVFPALIGGRPVLPWAAQSITVGLPGIAILVLINWLALTQYPPAPGGPTAA